MAYAQTRLNLRAYYSTSAPIRHVIGSGDQIETDPGDIVAAEGYQWIATKANGLHGFCAVASKDGAEKYIADKPGTVTPPPATTPVFGFHIMPGANLTPLVDLAKRGKVSMVTCLDAYGLQEMHNAGVKYVVYRPYLPPSINAAPMTGTPDDAELCQTWFNEVMFPRLLSIPKWAIIQPQCEQNATRKGLTDGYWYLKYLQILDNLGYKGVIFSDSVGSWGVQSLNDGYDAFRDRYKTGVLTYAKRNGHFVGAHLYGADKPTEMELGSDPDNTGAWRFYAGRIEESYKGIPEDGRADVLATEAGLFSVKHNPDIGAAGVIRDMHGFQARAAAFPYLKGIAYWTAGRWSDVPESNLDPLMVEIAAGL